MHPPFRVLAGENISSRFVVPTVASSVDLVVHLALDAHGRRRVHEIVGVPGRVESDVIEAEQIFAFSAGRLSRAHGRPPHPERFERAGYDLQALLAGEINERTELRLDAAAMAAS